MLPDFSVSERELSLKLQRYLVSKIGDIGPLTFSDYMQEALYHPEFGYYRNGCIKFGAEGDFVTSSEVSSLFSHCVARHCLRRAVQLRRPGVCHSGRAGHQHLAMPIGLTSSRHRVNVLTLG